MSAFEYSGCEHPIRDDIRTAHQRIWERLAAPGTWWTGPERVAIAAESRNALGCALCKERKTALSPYTVEGEHDHLGQLPPVAVEVVHRVVTDAGRLTRRWFDGLLADGLDEGKYVELLGVLVAVFSIDELHRTLGLPLEDLPVGVPGSPSRYRPAKATRDDGAFVPMLPMNGAVGDEADLWDPPRTGNVIRAMSLVPEAVRDLLTLSGAHYMPTLDVANPFSNGGRAIERGQIELIAGRVSALNECFY